MPVEMPNQNNKKVDKGGHFLLFKLFCLNCQEFSLVGSLSAV